MLNGRELSVGEKVPIVCTGLPDGSDSKESG